jgi:hypothetical protein
MAASTALYSVAEVEPDYEDSIPKIKSDLKNDPKNDLKEDLIGDVVDNLRTGNKNLTAYELEKEVYNYTKYILRLVRISSKQRGQDDPILDDIVKKYKPSVRTPVRTEDTEEEQIRRTAFSFSLLNTIRSVSPRESQLLLQTTDVCMRLEAMRDIIARSADLIADNLIREGNLLEVDRLKLMKQALLDIDDDADIFHP